MVSNIWTKKHHDRTFLLNQKVGLDKEPAFQGQVDSWAAQGRQKMKGSHACGLVCVRKRNANTVAEEAEEAGIQPGWLASRSAPGQP